MVNKKGWLRTVEVTMAVIMLSLFILNFTQTKVILANKPDVTKFTIPFLETISTQLDMRNEVWAGNPDTVANNIRNNFQSSFLDQGLNISIVICPLVQPSCNLNTPPPPRKDVHIYELIISSPAFDKQDSVGTPKRVKIYVWDL